MVCKPLNFILFFLITKINWDQVERTTRAGQNLTISIVLKADYTEMIALMNKMLTTDGSTVDIPCMLDVIDLFWSFLGLAHWGIFILVAQSWESSQCVPPWDKKMSVTILWLWEFTFVEFLLSLLCSVLSR